VRNWEAVTAKSTGTDHRSDLLAAHNQLCPKQKIAAAEQQKEIEALAANLKAQAAQIQKVSDQLRTQAQAPRVVAND